MMDYSVIDLLTVIVIFTLLVILGIAIALLATWINDRARSISGIYRRRELRGSHETNPFRPASPSVKTSRPSERTPPPPKAKRDE